MFIKYMHEDLGFDELSQLESSIKSIKDEIKDCEKQVSDIKYGKNHHFGRYNSELLSDEDRNELNLLDQKLSEINREYWDLYHSFMEEIVVGYDEDGHKEIDYEVKDKDLADKLRPRMDELDKDASILRAKIREFEKKIEQISKEAADKAHSDFDIEGKNAKLQSFRLEKKNLVANLLVANKLDWAIEALRASIDDNVRGTVAIDDESTDIVKEGNDIWAYVTYICTLSPDDIDVEDLDYDDSEYSLPDSHLDSDISDIIRWFNVSDLELESDDGESATFECVYISHNIDNNIECYKDKYDEINIEGDFSYEISFKIKANR